jgi:putative Mg2+ transporter-C (MgtC) family protein
MILDEIRILGLVLVSVILGGIIGFERELADKPAGLRTHMLVAASSTLLISLTSMIIPKLQIEADIIRTDPIRMIVAIVTGITFLGAGTIIRDRTGIEGLTTAASLLFVAVLGVTVALSQFVLAIGLTVLNLLILRGVKFFEKHFLDRHQEGESESS